MRPKVDTLARYPVFKNFSPSELSSVASSLTLHELSPGEALFQKGDKGSSMFFLDLGRVQIDVPTTPGNVKILARLEPPTLFGEMAILNNEPRSARAVAMVPSVLWEMGRDQLLALAQEKHAAAFKIMVWIASELSSRLRGTNDKLIEIYAKPFQSIQELKQQIGEMTPGYVSEKFELND